MTKSQAPADRFVILDLEFVPDQALYARYTRLDPDPASLRWPMERVISASVMSVAVRDGIFEVEGSASFSGPDDGEVVRELFGYLVDRPDHRLVTYAGLSKDLLLLRITAMEHSLKLPRQIRRNERQGGEWLHLDLAEQMRGGGRTFVHLSEVATRLNIPCKFGPSAMQIPHLIARGDYTRVAGISDADVVTTAMLLASHLAALGEISSIPAAHYLVLKQARKMHSLAPYHRYLGNVLDRVRNQMVIAAERWADAA